MKAKSRFRRIVSESRKVPVGTVFLRFTLPKKDVGSGARQGVLVASYELLESGELSPYERELVEEILRWFERQLLVPSALAKAGQTRAISWFKSDAHAPIKRMWDLVAILKAHGEIVEVLRTKEPGTVIYQDREQVVAIPTRSD
jgi:hypothetical protein